MLKRQISDSHVDSVHYELWAEAIKKHKTASSVPKDESAYISEYVRALYVLQVWAKDGSPGNPIRFLRSYGVIDSISDEVISEYCNPKELKEVKGTSRPEKRADKYAKLEKNALDNLYEEFTTDDLVEMSGMSYQTVIKWLKVSGFYRQVKRGLWEARNPKDDRESEKV